MSFPRPWRSSTRSGELGRPLRLRLIHGPQCPLCDEMRLELEAARRAFAFELEEVDVLSDPELVTRFALSVPVLEIEGRVAFEGRAGTAELEAALGDARARIATEGRGASPARER